MARPSQKKLELLQKMLAAKGIKKQAPATIPRRAEEGEPPLSFGQQRMWFLQQLWPESSEYNDTLTVRLRGCSVDVDLFTRCIQEIVQRHEVLRTSFESEGGVPVQRVLPQLEIPLRFVDLSQQSPDEQQAALRDLWLEEVRGAFVLDRPPLIRTALAKLSDDEHEFGLTMHHIVSDGVAYTIFFRELGELYAAFDGGQASPLEPLPIQFKDYAQWEHDSVTESVIQEKLKFWVKYLGDDLRPLALPVDRAPSGPAERRGAFLRFRFSDALFGAMQSYCKREKVTSNWVLLAAYFALMHRYSGQEDFAIGTPSSIRGRQELEQLIGFFVQSLILRLDLGGNPTFRQLIRRAQEKALEVSRYEDVPFDRIFQAVRPGKSAAEAPLIQAWIAPMKNLLDPLQLPGSTSTYEIVDPKNARFDVSLILDETPEQVTGYWEYDVSLFDAATIERMDRQFQLLLSQALHHPDTTLSLLRQTLIDAEPQAGPRSRPARKKMGDLKKIRRKPGQ